MLREELVFVGTCDIAGRCARKGLPRPGPSTHASRKGVGWTHSNLMQTAFGPILDTPLYTAGDLMIVPDPTVEVPRGLRGRIGAGTLLPGRHP